MKLNENTTIEGNVVLLVPYENYHVLKYHEWMKSEELQMLTASEPLSLEEEYKMQTSWRNDPDIKYHMTREFLTSFPFFFFLIFPLLILECTFIILDKTNYDKTKNEIKEMVGDTNIFLKTENGEVTGEVEIMIAEKSARRKGLGKEAVLLMLRYGIENLKISRYEAKIGMMNDASVSLFKKIGFEKLNENKIFNEYTFCRDVTESWRKWLESQTKFYCEKSKLNANNQY